MKIYQNYPLMQTVREEETFRTPKNIFLKALIFIGVFFVLEFAEGLGMMLGVMPRLMDWAREQAAVNGTLTSEQMTEKLNTLLQDPQLTYIMLLATGLGTLVVLFFCRVIEGRKLRTMGFFKEKAGIQYLAGLGIGFALFSCVVGLAYAFGGLQFEGSAGAVTPILLVILLGYGIQGMSEEVMCRGYLMTTIMRHHNVWVAVGINALFFGLMHGANAGFSLLALVNLILYAVMISLYTLRTNSLWGSCAIHSIWNFAQGNFYGLPVSGIDSGESVFRMSLKGSALVNGGDFGLEAGIPTSIVMLAAICILLFVPIPILDKKAGESA
ncbi:MAG: CPBP family intramembrane metalloprotease [Oscillospiraceae bacterium]|nr:CPBP family intramembrane metalloprotease [Oscillospiraceae bacterium]